MKKILVPTDFSVCADNAVEFAVQSAKIFPAKITIIHAFEPMGNLYTDYMGANKEFNQSELREVHNKLAKLKRNIEATTGIIVDTKVFTGGVKEGIVRVTNERNIDFIIMGTSGASGIKEKLWGSKTAGVITKSHVPVMAIPLEYKWKKPAQILLATNHLEKDPAILGFLLVLAGLYQAQVHEAVFSNEFDDTTETFLEYTRQTPEYRRMLNEQYNQADVAVKNLYGFYFEESIEGHIRQNKIDLLVMVYHKKGFPNSIIHSSMAKQMAYHSKIPFLAIPAKQE